jgi:four helix bundle protein
MGVKVFTDLFIWQRSRQWSKDIYQQTQHGSFCKDRRLVEQINDSSESVMANIAEGFGRGTQGEFITFLGYSLGSLNETQSHLCAAYDRSCLDKDYFAKLFGEGTEIRKMLVSFILSMIMPGAGVKHTRKHVNFGEQVWEMYERMTGKERPEFSRKKVAQ